MQAAATVARVAAVQRAPGVTKPSLQVIDWCPFTLHSASSSQSTLLTEKSVVLVQTHSFHCIGPDGGPGFTTDISGSTKCYGAGGGGGQHGGKAGTGSFNYLTSCRRRGRDVGDWVQVNLVKFWVEIKHDMYHVCMYVCMYEHMGVRVRWT